MPQQRGRPIGFPGAVLEGGLHPHQSGVVTDRHRDLTEHASPVALPDQMDHHVERRAELTVRGGPRKARRQGQRFDPCRDRRGAVGVQRPAAALVPGVQRRQQVHHLGTADLADDEAVRPHPECLPDQGPNRDLAGALDVGRSGLERHQVGVRWTELGGVLHHHQPLRPAAPSLSRAPSTRGLPRPGATGDEERLPGRHDRVQELGRRASQAPGVARAPPA